MLTLHLSLRVLVEPFQCMVMSERKLGRRGGATAAAGFQIINVNADGQLVIVLQGIYQYSFRLADTDSLALGS